MRKLKDFIKLDFMSIKPYLTAKNLVIFVVLFFILAFSSRSATTAVMGVLWFSVLFATYPFAIGEQNGIDALYTILGLERRLVVRGRYGFLLIMNLISILLALAAYLLATLILDLEPSWLENIMTIFSMFMVLTFVQCIQYVMFFKNGYMKAKLATIAPLFIIGGISLFAVQLYNFAPEGFNAFGRFAEQNPIAVIAALIAVWIAALFASYKTSCKYYAMREF